MRHRNKKLFLGRQLGHRKMLLRNLATSLFLYEKLDTTLAKAKVLRSYAERMITTAKIDTLAARRAALAKLTDKKAVKKLFEVIGPKYQKRAGGYTRIRRLSARRAGDAGEHAIISLVD